MKVASTFLKAKMCKVWQSAITNTFLTLKMWQEMCTRIYDWKCNNPGDKYDDRGGILG